MLDIEFFIQRYGHNCDRDFYKVYLTWQSDNDDIVKSYDHLLHQWLDKIFRERCLGSSNQIKEFLRGLKHDDHESIIKPILEQEPILSRHISKKELGKFSLLWISVLAGYENSAKLLVRYGADVNELFGCHECYDPKVIDEKWTVLHLLLRMNRMGREIGDLIRLIANLGADLQARDREGRTPLHYAVNEGLTEMVKVLLEKGADVNAVNNYGETPLLVTAVIPGADELVPLLMKHGADIFAKDLLGMNVLHRLALLTPVEDAPTELARVFIKMGVSLDDKLVDQQYQPIHVAAMNGNNELVKLYLDYGANVNALMSEGNESPLLLAALYRTLEVLKTLLKRGAIVDLKMITEHRTALHAACWHAAWSTQDYPDNPDDMEGVIRLLLSAGADVLAEDSKGLTPLAHITFYGNVDRPEIQLIVKMLVLKKALQPSIELKDEKIIERYQKLQGYYREYIQEIDKMKITRLIHTCSFFELLAKSHCQIAALMRNPEFKTKFEQHDLNKFPLYSENILQAYERAQKHHSAMVEQENVINEAFYNTLPYLVVMKLVHCILED